MTTVHRMLRPGTWTLRARLLAALLALLATVSIVVGIASVVTMDRFLLARLDDQLENASGRSRTAIDSSPGPAPLGPADSRRGGPDDERGPGFLLAPGQNEGTSGPTWLPAR